MTTRAASGPVDILSEIRAEIFRAGTPCAPGQFIDTMSADDRAAIIAAIDEGIHATAIARFIVKRGFPGRPDAAVNHLKGRCGCQQTR